MGIPLTRPFINQEIREKVIEVLDSGFLTEGTVTHEFEDAFQSYIGSEYAIAVTSCTAGLEIALRCLKIGPGDEVIVPDYTYPATAAVVSIVGAKAVIVDVCRDTMLIDCQKIEQSITPRTKAIIPVSIFGNPLDYDVLNRIKERRKLFIVEDAACSIGAEYKGKKVGTFADISVFSLHPRKFITTGEGGMITTDDADWAQWMQSYKHFGMARSVDREAATFERIGANYKLSNLQAAVGLVQMKHLQQLLDRRLELSENYLRLLKDIPAIGLPAVTPGGKHSRQSFCVTTQNRDGVLEYMRARDIEVQIGTYALHMHPAFSANPLVEIKGSLDSSRHAYDHCLTLPLYHALSFEQQQQVVRSLAQALQ